MSKKAASQYECSNCGRVVVMEPSQVAPSRCPRCNRLGVLVYRGGKWVYPADADWDRIGKQFLCK